MANTPSDILITNSNKPRIPHYRQPSINTSNTDYYKRPSINPTYTEMIGNSRTCNWRNSYFDDSQQKNLDLEAKLYLSGTEHAGKKEQLSITNYDNDPYECHNDMFKCDIGNNDFELNPLDKNYKTKIIDFQDFKTDKGNNQQIYENNQKRYEKDEITKDYLHEDIEDCFETLDKTG